MSSRFQQDGYNANDLQPTRTGMTDAEKAEHSHMELSPADHAVRTPTPPKDPEHPLHHYDGMGTAFERKVLRKIDFRLVPVLCESRRVALRSTAAG